MKKYWHKITVQNLETIQTKTLEFITKTQDRYNTTFHIFKWQEFTEAVPEILTAFDHLDMKVIMVSAYFMRNNREGDPHKDNTILPMRVNIPILNTTDTWTTFWEPRSDYVDHGGVLLPNGLKYYPYSREDLVEQTRCEITDATLIRPMEIHSVEFSETSPVPRITLTLCLDPLPYEYFSDIVEQPSIQDLTNDEWGEPHSSKREKFKMLVKPGYL